MIESLYAQLITDRDTQSIEVETDKLGVTIVTIYRPDCKITIRHRADDFFSCIIVER